MDVRNGNGQSSQQRRPNPLAKACVLCRTKKIRCDTAQPQCSACLHQGRDCVYRIEPPRKRPTFSQLAQLQREKAALHAFVLKLKNSSPEERDKLLAEAVDAGDNVCIVPGSDLAASAVLGKTPPQPGLRRQSSLETPAASDDELDIAHFISVDEVGKPRSFGPSSALHNPAKGETAASPSQQTASTRDHTRNTLIANAALQRQLEHRLNRLSHLDGVPIDLAMHLLNLHWTRQHHSFLLTYRPAIMRDLLCSGPYCTPFLLNAIFACSAKFSDRAEVRLDRNDPTTAGLLFFRRCDDLLFQDGLLVRPNINTVIGLLLLGSTYNARGETSKGWLYTGYALRMVYDLGLHLDPMKTTNNPEDVEIRRRVFWGAFVCDKLQSLYLGRPVAINLRDSQVSREFLDVFEEEELFHPLTDQRMGGGQLNGPQLAGVPIYSVSTFQQLCLLSKIMTTIINRFYVVGATLSNSQEGLQQVDSHLQRWKENLVPKLDFQPWLSTDTVIPAQPPNVMILHSLYHSLIILLHRPFISDGHLRRSIATPLRSWERCTVAAGRITSIALAYRSGFGLSGAPYVLGYSIYVACTIHVRNAVSQEHNGPEHSSLLVASLRCLDEMCIANPGVAKPAGIIRRLAEASQLDIDLGDYTTETIPAVDRSTLRFDLDTVFNTFPLPNGVDVEMELLPGYRQGLHLDMPLDPLFGLMDDAAMGFEQASSSSEL